MTPETSRIRVLLVTQISPSNGIHSLKLTAKVLNRPSQQETSIATTHFKVLCYVSFTEGICLLSSSGRDLVWTHKWPYQGWKRDLHWGNTKGHFEEAGTFCHKFMKNVGEYDIPYMEQMGQEIRRTKTRVCFFFVIVIRFYFLLSIKLYEGFLEWLRTSFFFLITCFTLFHVFLGGYLGWILCVCVFIFWELAEVLSVGFWLYSWKDLGTTAA